MPLGDYMIVPNPKFYNILFDFFYTFVKYFYQTSDIFDTDNHLRMCKDIKNQAY